MAGKTSQVLLLTLTVVAVLSQPSIDDPDFNKNIWIALCSGNLPAEPARDNYPLAIKIYPDPNLNTYRPNQQVRVTLRGVNPTFDFGAFLIQAHPPFDPSVKVGRWQAGPLGRPISCSDPEFEGDDGAAQKNVTVRLSQELVWIAPEQPGSYVFNLTTSERFRVYWVDQLSSLLRVVV
jgi:hypothetical protein